MPWVPDLRLPRVKWSMMCSSSGMPCVRSLGIGRWLGQHSSSSTSLSHDRGISSISVIICCIYLTMCIHCYIGMFIIVYPSDMYVTQPLKNYISALAAPRSSGNRSAGASARLGEVSPAIRLLPRPWPCLCVAEASDMRNDAKCQEIGHLYKLMDDHNIFKHVQDLVYGEIRRKPNP